MSEQTQNNPDYLQNHPNAVRDVEQAHAMALASDQYHTDAMHLRKAAGLLIEEYKDHGDANATLRNVSDQIRTIERLPEADVTPQSDQRLEVLTRAAEAMRRNRTTDSAVDDIADRIAVAQGEANAQENRVANRYAIAEEMQKKVSL